MGTPHLGRGRASHVLEERKRLREKEEMLRRCLLALKVVEMSGDPQMVQEMRMDLQEVQLVAGDGGHLGAALGHQEEDSGHLEEGLVHPEVLDLHLVDLVHQDLDSDLPLDHLGDPEDLDQEGLPLDGIQVGVHRCRLRV